MTEPACLTCPFFAPHTRHDRETHGEVNLPSGDCRFTAPRARLNRAGEAMAGYWPQVDKTSWCGAWRGVKDGGQQSSEMAHG